MSVHSFLIQFAFLYAPLVHSPVEQVTPYLYRGPDPKIKEIYALHDKGIKTIISLRTNQETKKQKLCQKLGMQWMNIKTGVFQTPTDEQLDQFCTIVNSQQNRPIYTACEIDMDRTTVYLTAYRVRQHGWTDEQVEEEFRKYHKKNWWPVFRKYERVVTSYAHDKRQQETSTPLSSSTLSSPQASVTAIAPETPLIDQSAPISESQVK